MQIGRRFATKRKKRYIYATAILIPLIIVFLLLLLQMGTRTTYVITDRNRVLVHMSSAIDPALVLGEAGLKLGANDTYTMDPGQGISRIDVRREQKLIVDYYGRQLEVTSQGESVEELLDRLNLEWSETDVLSVSPDAQTCDAMVIKIACVIQENQTYTTVLPHETIYCTDTALPEGEQRVMTEGVDGQMLCEAVVTYCNGIETERSVLSQQVISQPVHEIIAVGGGLPQAAEENDPAAVIGEGIITLPTGEVLTYTEKVSCLATAYACEGYVGTTATGTRARVGAIAVDPEVFPYGTRFYIVTKDGEYVYGVATAEDCGSKQFIYGTRLDLYFNTKRECIQFGARSCDVYILG